MGAVAVSKLVTVPPPMEHNTRRIQQRTLKETRCWKGHWVGRFESLTT